MWRHRNNTIHDKQCTIASKKKQEKIDDDIDNEFKLGSDDLRAQDKELMDVPKKKVKRWYVSDKIRWLQEVHIARQNVRKKPIGSKKNKVRKKLINTKYGSRNR